MNGLDVGSCRDDDHVAVRGGIEADWMVTEVGGDFECRGEDGLRDCDEKEKRFWPAFIASPE